MGCLDIDSEISNIEQALSLEVGDVVYWPFDDLLGYIIAVHKEEFETNHEAGIYIPYINVMVLDDKNKDGMYHSEVISVYATTLELISKGDFKELG